MKKIILPLIITVIYSTQIFAQKNTLLLYGGISLNTDKGSGSSSRYSTIGLSPGIGYQFNNNWTVGAEFNVFAAKSKSRGVPPSSQSSGFSAGPFIRYTKSLGEIFSAYAQFTASYSTGRNKINNTVQSKYHGTYAAITPGVLLKIKNGFALSLTLGSIFYRHTHSDPGTGDTSFGLSFGSGTSLGLTKNFSLKNKG